MTRPERHIRLGQAVLYLSILAAWEMLPAPAWSPGSSCRR